MDKKVKTGDGGAITNDGTNIYTTKGNKQDFWQYTPGATGIWTALTPIPLGSLGNKGVPKAGAALAHANGVIYLLKGNNLREFWQFIPTGKANLKIYPTTATTINVGQGFNLASLSLKTSIDISPNPITKTAIIQYSVPISSNVSIKLYNSSGRLVKTLLNIPMTAGTYNLSLNANTLAKGIYFLKYEMNNNTSAVKVIVQ